MEAALHLRDQLQSILEQSKPILVVNLADVDYIDSSGTGGSVSLLHGAGSQAATDSGAAASQRGAGLHLVEFDQGVRDRLDRG
jgi:hypothetical protein